MIIIIINNSTDAKVNASVLISNKQKAHFGALFVCPKFAEWCNFGETKFAEMCNFSETKFAEWCNFGKIKFAEM